MCCPRTLLYRPNVRLRYFSLARLLEASKLWAWFIHSDWHRTPAPARDRLLWMAVSIVKLLLELETNLRFGEVVMLNGHLNIIKVDMKFVG